VPPTEELLEKMLEELTDIKRAMADLISTTRFSRGGFIGPFTNAGRTKQVGKTPVVLVAGAEFPQAVTIETPGTGKDSDWLYIGNDKHGLRGAIRISLITATRLSDGNAMNIVVDRHQTLYAMAEVHNVVPEAGPGGIAGGVVINPINGEVAVRVYIGRL